MVHAAQSRGAAALKRGFTLVEMIVVVGIITLISGLVLVNNNSFSGNVILQNLAYDIALSVRQAQVYGISVQRFNGIFGSAYGMHFQVDSSNASTYALFADALDPVNGLYDCPSPGTASCELVQSTTVGQGYRISSVCVTSAGGTQQCGSRLDVTFKRPEPDACIAINGESPLNAAGACTGGAASARIVVTSPQGKTKSVVVDVNGQISVE